MQLLSGDSAVQEVCGCRLVRGPSPAEMSVRFDRCAMHNAAHELQTALGAFVAVAQFYHSSGHDSVSVARCGSICEALPAALAALAKVEGR